MADPAVAPFADVVAGAAQNTAGQERRRFFDLLVALVLLSFVVSLYCVYAYALYRGISFVFR